MVFGNVTASLIRNEIGAALYGLRIVEDITKRKRLEHELASHATTAGKLLASLTPRRDRGTRAAGHLGYRGQDGGASVRIGPHRRDPSSQCLPQARCPLERGCRR